MNEHLDLRPSVRVGRARHTAAEHDDVDDWSRQITEHDRYSHPEAEAAASVERGPAPTGLLDLRRDPTRLRQILRHQVYDRLPARPAVRFVTSYVLLGGFLDGRPGFDRSLFEAWQEMCIDVKSKQAEDHER